MWTNLPLPPVEGSCGALGGLEGLLPIPSLQEVEGTSRALVTPAHPHPTAELLFSVEDRLLQHSRGADPIVPLPKGAPSHTFAHHCGWMGLPHLAWDKGGREDLSLLQ